MAAFAALLATGASSAAAASARILCIGDSITQGGVAGRDELTYRVPLFRMLRDAGLAVEFIGTRQHGLDAAARWPADVDPDHEGYYGARAAAVRDALRENLALLPPADIALIDLGTNDAGTNPGRSVAPALVDIIAMLRARNPTVHVYLAEIPVGWRSWRFRWQIWATALDTSTRASPVVTVNQHSGWDPATDTFDGIHPNPAGQLKMAQRWFARILPAVRRIVEG